MNKYIFEIIRCVIYFSIPLFLGYLISIIKSISKKEKEKAELISLKTVNEIIKTVVMSLEQTSVKEYKNVFEKLDKKNKIMIKSIATRKINNIINKNLKLKKYFDLVNIDDYINEMIERKVLELSLNNKHGE